MGNNELKGTKKRIYEYITKYHKKYGYMPSYREIMTSCGLKSTATVSSHMNSLFDKGYFETNHPGAARAFRQKEGGISS